MLNFDKGLQASKVCAHEANWHQTEIAHDAESHDACARFVD